MSLVLLSLHVHPGDGMEAESLHQPPLTLLLREAVRNLLLNLPKQLKRVLLLTFMLRA